MVGNGQLQWREVDVLSQWMPRDFAFSHFRNLVFAYLRIYVFCSICALHFKSLHFAFLGFP